MLVLTHQFVGISDVVGMVVSEDYTLNLIDANAVGLQIMIDVRRINTGINEHSTIFSAQIGAIAAAATAETHKLHPTPLVGIIMLWIGLLILRVVKFVSIFFDGIFFNPPAIANPKLAILIIEFCHFKYLLNTIRHKRQETASPHFSLPFIYITGTK